MGVNALFSLTGSLAGVLVGIRVGILVGIAAVTGSSSVITEILAPFCNKISATFACSRSLDQYILSQFISSSLTIIIIYRKIFGNLSQVTKPSL